MTYIKKYLSITYRLNILIGVLLIVVLSIFSLFLIKQEKTRMLDSTAEWLRKDIANFSGFVILTTELTEPGFNEDDYGLLKPYFDQKVYFENGYPVLLHKNGTFLIHPDQEKESAAATDYYRKIVNSGQNEGYIKYRYPENNNGKWKYMYYSFIPEYNSYIGLTYYEEDLLKSLKNTKRYIWIGTFIVVALIIAGVIMILRTLVNDIIKLKFSISEMAKGKVVTKLEKHNEDEIGDVTEELNKLIDGLNGITQFASSIGEGNLNADFNLLSNDDALGKSMEEMRLNLKKAADEEKARKEEDDRRKWFNEGLAGFADILRRHQDYKKLGTAIIIEMVDRLKINQGGIFLLNEDDDTNPYFELVAAYAYNREKYMTKKIGYEEGLIGACALEKKTIRMNKIPNDYIEITSGLGKSTPNNLLIVPLLEEDKVLGVIELASFEELEDHYVEFIEKIAETMASTFASMKLNLQTSRLLEETRVQSQKMVEQEEEMRQNLEELQATQEESLRKEAMLKEELENANTEIANLKKR